MMTLIPIDRDTIRRNPLRGQRSFLVPGRVQCEAVVDANSGKFHVTKRRDVQRIFTTEPQPEWLYEYLPTEVECNYCGATFDHSELQSDSCDYSERICPECGSWDCCDIEFESIDDIMQEDGC